MVFSPFWDRAAHDEREHECKHGKPLHNRRRRHRQTEDRRLALTGVDGGSATLALQDANDEKCDSDQRPYAEQTRSSRWDYRSIQRKHDHDAEDDDRRRQHGYPDIASVSAV